MNEEGHSDLPFSVLNNVILENIYNMLMVNLFGAPGAGKSTGAAYIFSQLKIRDVNAELVTEFAKDKTWERNKKALENQMYMFGKQLFRITRCQDDVDVIITDSPLLLNTIYNHNPILGEEFNNLVFKIFNSYNNLNYYIKRVKKYNPLGRNQTEEESDQIADKVLKMLNDREVKFISVEGQLNNYSQIVEDVMEVLNGKERF